MSEPALEYDAYYHIYNRGNNSENLFREDRNYRHFLQLHAKYVGPIADTYAYCLLRNHFHVLVRIKTLEEQEAHDQTLRVSTEGRTLRVFRLRNPSQQFGNLFNAYAKAVNKAYQRTGSLFENPFRRIPVESDVHLAQLVTYIHQNPQKHGFVDDFRLWPYSSYSAIASDKPTQVKRDDVQAWFHGTEGFEAAHRQWVNERKIAPLLADDFDGGRSGATTQTLRVSENP